jgi:ubiquinone/menaquinone biosynthesis C-methylase UbiE
MSEILKEVMAVEIFQKIKGKIKNYLLKKKSIYEIFQGVYDGFVWNNEDNQGESLSGAGSTIKNTKQIRTALVSLIHELNIERMLDASCGDWNWMKLILNELPREYIGLDVTASVIKDNKEKYENLRNGLTFINIESLEYLKNCKECEFDIIFIRYTLEHLPTEYNIALLKEVKRCCKYGFITSAKIDVERTNKNCIFGDYRPINLLKTPYIEILGNPQKEFEDKVEDAPEGITFMNLYNFNNTNK